MKTFAESINEVKNAKVSNDEKIKMLLSLGLVKSDCYALFYKWDKEAKDTFSHRFGFTFGVEMEVYNCVDSNLKNIARRKGLNAHGTSADYNHTDSADSYKCVRDGSIEGNDTLECVSPILNEHGGLESLAKMCKALKESGAKVNKSCGLHVHIGAKSLTDAQYINVFNNYKMLEDVIDTFMANSRRGRNSHWCDTLKNHEFSHCITKEDVRSELRNRYHKVNAYAYSRHQTIEFRQHAGSINFEKISNWVMFVAKLVEFSKTNKLTSPIACIDDIPFITSVEKDFFKKRQLNTAMEA